MKHTYLFSFSCLLLNACGNAPALTFPDNSNDYVLPDDIYAPPRADAGLLPSLNDADLISPDRGALASSDAAPKQDPGAAPPNMIWDIPAPPLPTGGVSSPPVHPGMFYPSDPFAPSWNCALNAYGQKVCVDKNPQSDLPPFGKNWECNSRLVKGQVTWDCFGEILNDQYLFYNGWYCTHVETFANLIRCQKTQIDEELPSLADKWACLKGSAYQGTICALVAVDPYRNELPRTCHLGQSRWCAGETFSGWGVVKCDGYKWATIYRSDGSEVLDCRPTVDGRRPATFCSNYHPWFKRECCERPDCLLPDSSLGKIVENPVGGLCAPCDPYNPNACASEHGARCLVDKNGEAFCGLSCLSSDDCYAGYYCATVRQGGSTLKQCVPEIRSCLYFQYPYL